MNCRYYLFQITYTEYLQQYYYIKGRKKIRKMYIYFFIFPNADGQFWSALRIKWYCIIQNSTGGVERGLDATNVLFYSRKWSRIVRDNYGKSMPAVFRG